MLQSLQTTTDSLNFSEVSPATFKVIVPKGMIGFHDIFHFVMKPLLPHASEHIFWQMTSENFASDEDKNALSFILMAVDLSSDQPSIQEQVICIDDIEKCVSPLGIKTDECLLFVVVSIEMTDDNGGHNITVNVRAPFIFHTLTKQGWQIILPDRHYPIALPLIHG